MEPRAEDKKLGRIALANHLLTQEQLDECLREQQEGGQNLPLGLILLRKGYLDDEQLQQLCEIEEKHQEVQAEYRKGQIQDLLFATLVVQRGLAGVEAVREALAEQATLEESGQPMRLGQILVRRKAIPADRFVELLKDQAAQSFRCQKCNESFAAEELRPGNTFACERCGELLKVPTMDQALQLLGSAPGKPVTPRTRKRSGPQPAAASGERPAAEADGRESSRRVKPEKAGKKVALQPAPEGALLAAQGRTLPEPGKVQPIRLGVEPAPEMADTAAIRQTILRGEHRIGQYEVLGEIAQGGMGIVYKARQTGLNRVVALKILKDKLEAKSEQVLRFQREAKAVSLLNHPNIVSIIEVGNADGLHFMTMDFIEGQPLDEVIEQEGRIEARRAMKIMARIADAIHYAHSCNIVHRDLKPSNVIVDDEDQPHITDFGLAKKLDSKSKLTETGALVGTPYYMAPEQISEGSQMVRKSWDVYALGVILYEMVTGQLPFDGETTMEVYHQILNNDPKPPRGIVRTIPPPVERITLKALARDETLRYRSVAELGADIHAFLEGKAVAARPPGFLARVLRRYDQNVVLYTVIACALVVAVGAGLILWIRKAKGARAAALAPAPGLLEPTSGRGA